MVTDKNTVLDYFNEYIFGFMYSDIKNCIEAKANVAVASVLMTYTEQIGALIRGNLGEIGKSKDDFNHFLEYFEFNGDQSYYKDFRIKYKDNSRSNVEEVGIYKAFRCGLIHEYFPKIPCIIKNNPDRADHCIEDTAGIGWIDHQGKKALRFYTNAYFRDFKKAVDKVFRQVFVQNDAEIICNIEKSLNNIFNRELIVPSE